MTLDYKGISIHYIVEGHGKAVVLLHGFLENTAMWDAFTPVLASSYTVITIDLLGHGKTGCSEDVHTMEAMAEAVCAVLKVLKVNEASFVGHSMGGYVALAFAELYPKQIKALCLMNSTAEADSRERRLNRNRAIEAVKQNQKAFVSMAVANLFAPENTLKLKTAIDFVKQEAQKTPLKGIVAALEGMKIRSDRTALFRVIPIKKMLIIGEKDSILDVASVKASIKNKDIKCVVFSGGHMSYIENESACIKAVNSFLSD